MWCALLRNRVADQDSIIDLHGAQLEGEPEKASGDYAHWNGHLGGEDGSYRSTTPPNESSLTYYLNQRTFAARSLDGRARKVGRPCTRKCYGSLMNNNAWVVILAAAHSGYPGGKEYP